MTKLSVNVNKVAWLRNGRGGAEPDPVVAAEICVAAGAHGITVHPRPDQRHITVDDVYRMAEAVRVEYNIEGNPFSEVSNGYPGFMHFIRELRPTQATLVPDASNQLTSDHGWAIAEHYDALQDVIAEIKSLGVRVSLFMDATSDEWEQVAELQADRIELYTEGYAQAFSVNAEASLRVYRQAAKTAQALGLGVNAGHDLNLDNLSVFLTIPDILEVSIGHALISDSLKWGLDATVRRYLNCLPGK